MARLDRLCKERDWTDKKWPCPVSLSHYDISLLPADASGSVTIAKEIPHIFFFLWESTIVQ